MAESGNRAIQAMKAFFFLCRGSRNIRFRLQLRVKCSALCITVWSLLRLSSGSVHTLQQQAGCPREYQGGLGGRREGEADREEEEEEGGGSGSE